LTILPAISILCQQVGHRFAEVAELADAHDSKSCGEIRVGSIPTFGTVSLARLGMTSAPERIWLDGHYTPGEKGCESKVQSGV